MSELSTLLTAGAQLAIDSLLVRPRRSVGPMVLQVTISESHADEMEITDHPIEQGAVVSDHAFKRPAEVTIQGAWSLSPNHPGLLDGILGGLKATVPGVKNILSGQAPQGLPDIYNKLLRLQKDAVPFDIYTGKRKYANMMIRSLQVTTDKASENSLLATIVCREVLIVQTRVIVVPDVSRQADPQATASPISLGSKSLSSGSGFSNAGAGRGFVNPALVTP